MRRFIFNTILCSIGSQCNASLRSSELSHALDFTHILNSLELVEILLVDLVQQGIIVVELEHDLRN